MAYPHKYKYGKQELVMELDEFKEAMQRAEAMGTPLSHLAYLTALWHTGVRKSELYERPLSDVTVTKNFVTIDFGIDYGYWTGHRKKHGDKVPPLDIPRNFYGVEDWLIPHIFSRIAARPPHRWSKRHIKYEVDTGQTIEKRYRLRNGEVVVRTVPLLEWRKEQVRSIWLFPKIGSTTALDLTKRVLGDKYYPHYLRLRKLSAIAANPETASIVHLKSVSGIRSISELEAYLGVSKKAQDEAMQVE